MCIVPHLHTLSSCTHTHTHTIITHTVSIHVTCTHCYNTYTGPYIHTRPLSTHSLPLPPTRTPCTHPTTPSPRGPLHLPTPTLLSSITILCHPEHFRQRGGSADVPEPWVTCCVGGWGWGGWGGVWGRKEGLGRRGEIMGRGWGGTVGRRERFPNHYWGGEGVSRIPRD